MNAQLAAPVFQMTDLEATLDYYQKVLGFEPDFRVGNYAGVKLGNVVIHLSKRGEGEFAKPVGSGIVYIFCDEVDGYFSEIEVRGARVKYPPGNTTYGMREFRVADLDGHHLAFGCDYKPA